MTNENRTVPTPTVDRVARLLCAIAERDGYVYPGSFGVDWDTTDAFYRDALEVLDIAFNVEEMAAVIWASDYEGNPEKFRYQDEGTQNEYLLNARAIRTANLGEHQ